VNKPTTTQDKSSRLERLAKHTGVHKSLDTLAQQSYNTPWFVFRQAINGFFRHNVFGLAAGLSFYALLALIPMILLIFFLLSHLIFSSDYTIVKLAILTGNLVPQFSSTIMVEVYNATQTKAAWGALGIFILLWSVTPLAGALRSAFHTIASIIEHPSFIKRKLKDVISVIGILVVFFLFTSAGFAIEQAIVFMTPHIPVIAVRIFTLLGTILVTTILITLFYKAFFPMRVALSHLLIGAFLTASLWLLMRPAFGVFLSLHHNYGAVFGSLKNMFLSITWLYINFAAFLLGTELIATLRKKDVLMLKGLFDGLPNKQHYIQALMQRYGLHLRKGDYIFERGNTERNLYYLVSGQVVLYRQDKALRELNAGDYFGELAILTSQPTTADAVVTSDEAQIIVIYAEHIDTILADDPKVSMRLLKHLANRFQNNYA